MKHLCVQLLSMLSLASFWKIYPWIRERQGATLMNDIYRKITVYKLHYFVMTPQFFYEEHKQEDLFQVSSCAWTSCRKEIENYYRCSLRSLGKMFGEIYTAKMAIRPHLQFWCLKELSVFQKVSYSMCWGSSAVNNTAASLGLPGCRRLLGPHISVWSLHFALPVNFLVFQNLALHSFDNRNKIRGCMCALWSPFALVSPWTARSGRYHLTCLTYSQIPEFGQAAQLLMISPGFFWTLFFFCGRSYPVSRAILASQGRCSTLILTVALIPGTSQLHLSSVSGKRTPFPGEIQRIKSPYFCFLSFACLHRQYHAVLAWWLFLIVIYFGHLGFEVILVYSAGVVLDLSQW